MSSALRNKSKEDWRYGTRIMTKNFLVRLLREMTKNKEGGTAVSKSSSRLDPRTVGLGFVSGHRD